MIIRDSIVLLHMLNAPFGELNPYFLEFELGLAKLYKTGL